MVQSSGGLFCLYDYSDKAGKCEELTQGYAHDLIMRFVQSISSVSWLMCTRSPRRRDVQVIGLNGMDIIMQHLPISEAIPETEEILESLSVGELIASWQSDFKIDVKRLFIGLETLHLLKNRQTGRLSFYPAVEGDAAFYQDLRRFEWYHPATKEEFATAANYYRAGERVLDIGAGAGGFAGHVERDLYCGLETDRAAASAGRGKGLNIINADMASFMAADNFQTAGLVTAFQVLEHVQTPDVFVKEMTMLTCVGGRVAIGVPDAGSYVADLPDFMLNAPPHHLTWWTERALGATMEQAGLRIIGVHRFGVEPWERQLWWMAKFARLARPEGLGRFGASSRGRKVVSFLGSWAVQKLPIPSQARGSTLLMIGEKVGQ